MEGLVLALLASTAVALPAVSSAQAPAIPLRYSYGGYPRIEADIRWGTKPQTQIPTIFDTGSVGFWTYGPNATINDGSQYHFTQGPCNKSVKSFYDWPKSSTHTKLQNVKGGLSYSYGGNGKIISAQSTINDTFSFPNTNWPGLKNQQVALANLAVVTQLDENCAIEESTFDHSILGLAPFGIGSSSIATIGPSFRKNMRDQGQTKSSSFSMWFDKPPTSVSKGQYNGTAIFGAVPSKDKYSGELVRLKLAPPEGTYIGYYVGLPTLTAKSTKAGSVSKTIKSIDTSVKQCLIDSGTGTDNLPFSQADTIKAAGLIQYSSSPDGTTFTAWNGTCDSIPASATLNFTFAGATAGKKVTIAVPIRSYARGQFEDIPGVSKKVCGLSLNLDNYGSCTFGAPFFTAAFAVFNDDKKQVAFAQGGVSTGSTSGPSGLGAVTTIVAGQDIPGSV